MLSLEQGGHNSQRGVKTSTGIGNGDSRSDRPLPRKTGHRHHSPHTLDDLVEARTLSIGPRLPETRNTGQDNARVYLLQRLVIDPQALLYVGPPVLDNHVSLFDHFIEYIFGFRLFEVKRQRTLVSIEVLEVATKAHIGKHICVGIDAHRRFDTNYVGTKICQHTHASGSCSYTGEIKYTKMFERTRRLNLTHMNNTLLVFIVNSLR